MLKFLIGIAVGIGISLVLNKCNSESLPDNYVQIKVVNESNTMADAVDLHHKIGDISAGRIYPNEPTYFYFNPHGENVIVLHAYFDGLRRSVESDSTYVEYGDHFSAIIRKDTILLKRNN